MLTSPNHPFVYWPKSIRDYYQSLLKLLLTPICRQRIYYIFHFKFLTPLSSLYSTSLSHATPFALFLFLNPSPPNLFFPSPTSFLSNPLPSLPNLTLLLLLLQLVRRYYFFTQVCGQRHHDCIVNVITMKSWFHLYFFSSKNR